MNYILVVDDEADIRDIYEVVLKRTYPLDVVSAASGNLALKVIQERGLPQIIISDLNMQDGDGHYLYKKIKENKWEIPFVLCTTDSQEVAEKRFPDIHGYIEKPNITGAALELIDRVVSKHVQAPSYVPLRISLLLRWGEVNYDLFMKLSEKKFVKVINAGEAFIPADAERFQKKGIDHLYITSQDADQYVSNFEKHISALMKSGEGNPDGLSLISLENFEAIEKIAGALGWTPQVLEAAKHAVNLAVRAVSSDPNILKLLKKKLSNPTSKFSSHISKLSLLSCGISYQLGWVSESTHMKLGLASLMHDLTVDESIYDDVMLWNQTAADLSVKTPEAIKYRNHPADAANLLLSIKNLPPDVDHIVLQHHEARDGSGFPRGLISSRILPLSCIFIIVEDLINYLEASEDFEAQVDLFLKHKETVYNSGNFKKVFDTFKESVQKMRQP
jgi:response regulator RpfG family c-di-GMP phosphodiesterase